MTHAAEQPRQPAWGEDRAEGSRYKTLSGGEPLTFDELLKRRLPSPFESDEEMAEFLEDLYASRRRGME